MTGTELLIAGILMQVWASVEGLRNACPPYYKVMPSLIRVVGILLFALSMSKGN